MSGIDETNSRWRGLPIRNLRQGRIPIYARAAILALGLLPLLIAACAPSNSNTPSLAKDQVFTWPYQQDTTSLIHGEVLDPALIQTATDLPTVDMIYTSLVTFNSNLGVIPDAATHWDVDSTGTIYTFHLKPNLRFSDGTPLTASDFAYSINRALDPTLCTVQDTRSYGPQNGNPNYPCTFAPVTSPNAQPPIGANYLGNILGADARLNGAGGSAHSLIGQGNDPSHGLDVVDPQTLIIRLAQPVSFFLEALTYPTSMPVERSLINKYPGGLWVDHLNEGGCSGPFQIKSYGGGKQISMVPNPYWEKTWGKSLTLTQVNRPLVQNVDLEYQNYLSGQYDFTGVPTGQYSFAHGQDDFHEVPTLETHYFGFNFLMAPFNNLQVRRAFALALNKQLLVDHVLNGSELPSNHIVPLGMPGYDASLTTPPPDKTEALTGNQSAAQTLMSQARSECTSTTTPTPSTTGAPTMPTFCPYIMGANPQEIDVYVDSNDITQENFVKAATQEWSSVLGLNVQTKIITFSDLVAKVFTNPVSIQAWNLGWLADYPDPQDFLSLQFKSTSGNNASRLVDPALDKLMAQADANQSSTQRMQQYNQIEQSVIDAVAWIPYSQGKAYWRQRLWVHGFGLNSLQYMVDINWPNVYIAQH